MTTTTYHREANAVVTGHRFIQFALISTALALIAIPDVRAEESASYIESVSI